MKQKALGSNIAMLLFQPFLATAESTLLIVSRITVDAGCPETFGLLDLDRFGLSRILFGWSVLNGIGLCRNVRVLTGRSIPTFGLILLCGFGLSGKFGW